MNPDRNHVSEATLGPNAWIVRQFHNTTEND
jgi:hypothetical protein